MGPGEDTGSVERAIGRLEGKVSAMKDQLGHFNTHLDALDVRSSDNQALLKSVIAEKKGELRIWTLTSAFFGGGLAIAFDWWMRMKG